MPRLVTYTISDREDGRFDVTATIVPDKAFRRCGFASLAEAEEWVEGLRVIMAAIGAPVTPAAPDESTPGIASARDPARARREAE